MLFVQVLSMHEVRRKLEPSNNWYPDHVGSQVGPDGNSEVLPDPE